MDSSYYRNDRMDVLKVIPNTPKNVLELGCGEGNFGSLLKQKYNCNVTGIDISSAALSKAKGRIDKIYHANIDEFDFSKLGKFDLVVANDCLEHLREPWEVVAKLKNNISADGYFVASIPNVRNYQIIKDVFKNGRWDYVDSGLLDRTHLRFFTKENMIELFKDNQYIVEEIIPTHIKRIKKRRILKFLLKKYCPDLFVLQFIIIAKNVN
jgi:Predicted methyltransferase (contains TPR repeat)